MVVLPPEENGSNCEVVTPALAPAAVNVSPAHNLLYEEIWEDDIPSQTQLLNTALSYGGDFDMKPRLAMYNRRQVDEDTRMARVDAQRKNMLQLNPSIFKGEDHGRYLFLDHQEADYEAARHITADVNVHDRRFATAGGASTQTLTHLQRAIDINTFQNNYQASGGYDAWAATASKPMLPFVNPHHRRGHPSQRKVPQTSGDFAFPGVIAAHASVQMPDQANWRYADGHHGLFADGYIG
jgi:hypothetical protein